MAKEDPTRREVDKFIYENIESVPHLEALLLFWESKPKMWSVEEMAKALYIPSERAQAIFHDLEVRRLVASQPDGYVYNPDTDRDKLISDVDNTYRRDLIRISTMIHSKASQAVREFARAFKLKKD